MTTSLDRRDVILERAADLFAKQGVAATTVREIAEAVGILSGSLYHHFSSKDAIVDAIVAGFMDDLVSRYEAVLANDEGPAAKLRGLVQASLATSAEHPHATEIYQNDVNYLSRFERFGYLKNAGREVQRTWLDVIRAGVAQKVFRTDLDPKVLYRLMRDAVWLSARWFRPTRAYPVARLAQECTSLFLDGLAARR